MLSFILSIFLLLSGASPVTVSADSPSTMVSSSAAVAQSNAVCPIAPPEEARRRMLGTLFENAQGRIQPVLLTDGSRTGELERSFNKFKAGLPEELSVVLREPKTIRVDQEMKILGEAFPDGINASAVRNKLQIFDSNVLIVVYTDFVFSPFRHRDPTNLYSRSQFDVLNQSGGSSPYNQQTEADFLMWLAYIHL